MRALWSPFPFTVYVPSTLSDCPPPYCIVQAVPRRHKCNAAFPASKSLLARAVFCADLVFYPLVLFQSRLPHPETHLPTPQLPCLELTRPPPTVVKGSAGEETTRTTLLRARHKLPKLLRLAPRPTLLRSLTASPWTTSSRMTPMPPSTSSRRSTLR
jgi:hypothetical protein